MDNEANKLIEELRYRTGVGWDICKEAYDYAVKRNGSLNMMIAYVKARTFALYHSGSFDSKVDMFLKGLESEDS